MSAAMTIEKFKTRSGKYTYRIKASNGQVIARGPEYMSRPAMNNAVRYLIGNITTVEIKDLTNE